MLAVALLLLGLGRAPIDAAAGLTEYSSTLYLSGTASSLGGVLGGATGSYQLVTTATPVGGAPPATKNRIAVNTTGYQDFSPGFTPALTTQILPTPTSLVAGASTTPNNKGWIVDGFGGVSFAAGTWTFQNTLTQNAAASTAFATLAVGLWKVRVTAGAISSSTLLADPNCSTAPCASGAAPGFTSPGTNFVTVGGSTLVTLPVALVGFSLASDEHLYVQYWRRQSVAMAFTAGAANRLATLSVNDGTALITHPTANGFPNVPALGSVAARVNTTPQLSATFSDPDASDTGTLSFQLCSDSACNTVLQSGSSSSGIANNAGVNWTPSLTLVNGTTYFWQASAQDSSGNPSGWSTAGNFTFDTTPPNVPALGAVAPRVNAAPQLSAAFSDTDAADTGSLSFQLCTSSSCGTVLQSGSSAGGLGSGAAGSWTPSALAEGVYHWRVRAQDLANNTSAWSSTNAFVVDTTPPPAPGLLTRDGMHVQSEPVFTARLDTSDPDDRPSLVVQICADPGCAIVLTVGYATGAGADEGWQWPQSPADGVYYWRASAQDVAGNQSGFSSTRSFVIDHTPPDVPALGSPVADALVARPPTLSAAFTSSDASDSGTILYQVCADVDCATLVASGSSAGAGAVGSIGSWTPDDLADGSYFWRAQAVDAAGNASAWSSVQSFTLDTTPPGRVRDFKVRLAGHALTLRWKSPAGGSASGGYALFVGGAQMRVLDPGARAVTIRVRANDKRSFSVAAVDTVGNVGRQTRRITLVPQFVGLTLRQATATAANRRFKIRWARSAPGKQQAYVVVAQTPAAPSIVAEGSAVTVVAGAKSARPHH